MARRLIPPLNRILAQKINATTILLLCEKNTKVGWIAQFWSNYSTKYSNEIRPKGDSNYNDAVMGQSRIYDQYHQHGHQYDNESMLSKIDNTGTGRFSEDNPGKNVSRKDKIKFLVDTLLGLKESKEAVYGALDAWVAWEQSFPIAPLRIALGTLEKQNEWHRIIQVIKWVLSKGQGNTMGIYQQLIKALDMDHRPEEAHNFWMKKIGSDLHSVPSDLCTLMISLYYRNNMLERLIKLFKGLESFDRKPPKKSVLQKVANAYEILGLDEENNRVLEKYNDLFTEPHRWYPEKASRKARGKKRPHGKK